MTACFSEHDSGSQNENEVSQIEQNHVIEVAVRDFETVIATQGEHSITVIDLLRKADWVAFLSQKTKEEFFGPEWFRDRRTTNRLILSILAERTLLQDAEEFELVATGDQIEQERLATPILGEISFPSTEYPYLNEEIITDQLQFRVLYHHWTERIKSRVTEEILWEFYQRQAERMTIDVFTIPNIPTPAAIDLALQDREQIAELYQQQFRRRVPAMAYVARYVWSLEEENEATIAREALLAGVETSLPEIQLEWVSGRTERELSTLEEEGISEIKHEEETLSFFVIQQLIPSHIRELDETLEREIAASIAAKTVISAECQTTADRLYAALIAHNEEEIAQILDETLASQAHSLPIIRSAMNGMVPGVGNEPELYSLLFSAEIGAILDPYFADNNLIISTVLTHEFPTRVAFENSSEEIRERYFNEIEQSAWEQRIREIETPISFQEELLIEVLMEQIP